MKTLAALLLALFPLPAAAHPHIFIDTGVDVIVDASGRLTQVRVTWVYDDYYSLLITEDMGLDADHDGTLTAEEQARLTGFDMQWIDGFEGDLEAVLDGARLALSGPMEPTAELRDGRIVTTHLRAVTATPDLAGRTLTLTPYDPTYYTAYEISLPVRMVGGTCMIENLAPDIDAGLEEKRQMLLRIDADADLEELDIPLMGAEFATQINISCPGS